MENKLSTNPKFTSPLIRQSSSNIPKSEIVDQDDSAVSSEILPTMLRKSKRLKVLKTKKQTNSENKSDEGFKMTLEDIESDKSKADNEEVTEMSEKNLRASPTIQENSTSEKNLRASPTIQENSTESKEKVVKDNIELEVDHDGTNNINHTNDTTKHIYKEKEMLQSKHTEENDQVNILSIPSASVYYELMTNLNESSSAKIINADTSQKLNNVTDAETVPIQELKILKIVLEDAYHIQKQEKLNKEILLKEKLENMPAGGDIKCLNNNQKEGNVCKYEKNVNSQEKDFGSRDKGTNKTNISSVSEHNENNNYIEIQADDMESKMSESHCSSDVENKVLTIDINGNSNNVLDNSDVENTSYDEEKCCSTLTILSNEPDIKIDLNKNLPNPKMENKCLDTDTKVQNRDIKCNGKSPKVFNSKLKSTNKILTIPCMSALDYEKECAQNQTSSSLNYKEIPKMENLTSLNENFSEMQNLEDLKMQDEDIKQIWMQSLSQQTVDPCCSENKTLSNGLIMSEDNDINLEENLPKEEICTTSENNLNEITQKGDSEVLKDTIATLNTENFNILQPTNKSDCNIFSDENLAVESITFREKSEAGDSDVIPTGVFKHLNEVYKYNKETALMLVKDPVASNLSSLEEQLNDNGEDKGTNKHKSKMASIEEESKFLVAAADYIKITKSQKRDYFDEEISDITDEKCSHEEKKRRQEIEIKEDRLNQAANEGEHHGKEINKINKKLINESPMCQRSPLDETDFSDIENCMEMDDDFALTASQLRMLDADERTQSQPTRMTNTTQQTDICGYTYFGNDAVTFEIINQLQYIRENVEYIKKRLETVTSSEKNAL